ncbi:hypothetical protein ASZ90_016144 [hydrocarbon metagenome]|uniref:Uncharacterized protein n=1 Tax=hydrocarbon metagenome TaxID=938273 RepID=A0A0W8F017_9ZZZZ
MMPSPDIPVHEHHLVGFAGRIPPAGDTQYRDSMPAPEGRRNFPSGSLAGRSRHGASLLQGKPDGTPCRST